MSIVCDNVRYTLYAGPENVSFLQWESTWCKKNNFIVRPTHLLRVIKDRDNKDVLYATRAAGLLTASDFCFIHATWKKIFPETDFLPCLNEDSPSLPCVISVHYHLNIPQTHTHTQTHSNQCSMWCFKSMASFILIEKSVVVNRIMKLQHQKPLKRLEFNVCFCLQF